MIKFEKTWTTGWDPAIRGMRNPKNSWHLSDSVNVTSINDNYHIGDKDLDLAMRLVKGGPVHAKFRRMIKVYVDITAPLYWWKEFDTYKVGTVANSCSTMHKLTAKEFTRDDFSFEHLVYEFIDVHELGYTDEPTISSYVLSELIIEMLNHYREQYLICESKLKNKELQLTKAERKHVAAQKKAFWWQMIQLLPSSYNQKRTIELDYEVLANIYHSRYGHPLDEWCIDFINWIETLPYSELITGEKENEKD